MPPPVASGSITLVTASPKRGELIQFACAVDGLHGKQHARIAINGYQNGEPVYGEHIVAFHDDFPAYNGEDGILLAGGSNLWSNNIPPADSSQPAQCVATLFYFAKPPSSGYTVLDTVEFTADGA